ncbi:sensor histidine kinase [Lysobacter fragariae]
MTSPPSGFMDTIPGLRRMDSFDRSVLVLTVGVWAMHFLMRTTVSFYSMHYEADLGTLSARAVATTLGILLSLGIHLLLRRRYGGQPWRLLLMSVLLTLPATIALTYIGEHIFYHLSPYYRMYPERWMHREELGETYKAYQWNFFAWAALYAAAAGMVEVRRREQQLADANSAAQQAQLLALRLQINPHFLFNTLNTLAGLIVLGRNGESEKMVLSLSRFLRYTLATTPSQLTTLADETGMLRQYLEIESARFSDRLTVTWNIPDECETALVPSLILLPLVENALKYGLGASERPVVIAISARRAVDVLVLQVEDDGGTVHEGQVGMGIGLSNVRQRLDTLYGEDASLRSGPLDTGWQSAIRVPFQKYPTAERTA